MFVLRSFCLRIIHWLFIVPTELLTHFDFEFKIRMPVWKTAAMFHLQLVFVCAKLAYQWVKRAACVCSSIVVTYHTAELPEQ